MGQVAELHDYDTPIEAMSRQHFRIVTTRQNLGVIELVRLQHRGHELPWVERIVVGDLSFGKSETQLALNRRAANDICCACARPPPLSSRLLSIADELIE
jgi:hypothetical protein